MLPAWGLQHYLLRMGSDGISEVPPACGACPHHLPRELLGLGMAVAGASPLRKGSGGPHELGIFHNSQKTGIQEARKEEDGELTAQMTRVRGQIHSGHES